MTNLEKLLNELPSDAIAIYFSGDPKKAENDENFVNFYNYTNIIESECILLVNKNMNQSFLFIPENTEYYSKWLGTRITREAASEASGIPLNRIMYKDVFENYYPRMFSAIKTNPLLYLDLENNVKEVREFTKLVKDKYPAVIFRNTLYFDDRIRQIKSADQIEKIKLAIEITNEGVKDLMLNSSSEDRECQLESYFDKVVKYHDCGFSFETIAASGINATCLHYSENNSEYKDGDLILFDLGARYEKMCADISRTFPVNGKFTKRQADVYSAVLRTNKEIINMVGPDISIPDMNKKTVELLTKELLDLGLITEDKEVYKYYFHSVTHHLGLICHDYGSREDKLLPGSIVTVEPGLYIPEWNIGIRIEDDILVTENGHVNLSSDIIKEIKDIEEFMA